MADRYAFRLNDYYAKLINWNNPKDPLRRLVVPDEGELAPWGALDASDEASYTPVRGCQHKYTDTALLVVSEVCGAYCRYCFRKRLFMNDNDDASIDHSRGLAYIGGWAAFWMIWGRCPTSASSVWARRWSPSTRSACWTTPAWWS